MKVLARPGEKQVYTRTTSLGPTAACSWCCSMVTASEEKVAAWVAKHEQERCGRAPDPMPTTNEEAWLWQQARGRTIPLIDLNESLGECPGECQAGFCNAPGTTMGCGGCCYCLGGCYKAYGEHQAAPHVWEGD